MTSALLPYLLSMKFLYVNCVILQQKSSDTKQSDLRYRGQSQPPPTVVSSRRLISKDAKMYLDSDSENSEDEDYIRKMDGFEAVKGEAGLYYKVSH